MTTDDTHSLRPRDTFGSDVALTLAYLTCPQDGAKSFLGALLITDERTRPLHFAYVEPIRPTLLQRIVYGSTLTAHVQVDIIAKKLFREDQPYKPDVAFVDTRELLVVRQALNIPTACLRRSEQGDNALSAFTFDTGDHYSDAEPVSQLIQRLEPSGVDLLDPFARMKDAIKEVLRGEPSQ